MKHVFTPHTLGDLEGLLIKMPKDSEAALAVAINKAAGLTIKESVNRITQKVTLEPSYVRSRMLVESKATPKNLSSTISARDRATLTGRFKYSKGDGGYYLQVNKSGGGLVRRSWLVKSLPKSGGTALVMTAKDALAAAESSGGQMTPARAAKISRLRAKAAQKQANGRNKIVALYSRSINQLFTSVREEVDPFVGATLTAEFIKDFKKRTEGKT